MKPPALLALLLFASPLSLWAGDYAGDVRIQVLLKTDTNALGIPLAYPEVAKPEVTAFEAALPPGAQTGWHVHPYPGYAYVLAGELTLEAEGGQKLVLRKGDAYAELVNVRHNGRNLGKDTVRLVAFFTGEKGKAFTKKAEHPLPEKIP
jgi:quercetin dioxygenase-like cupin family protein